MGDRCQYCQQHKQITNKILCKNHHTTSHCNACLRIPCKKCSDTLTSLCNFCSKSPSVTTLPCSKHSICKTCIERYPQMQCTICYSSISPKYCQYCKSNLINTSFCQKHHVCSSCYYQQKGCSKCKQSVICNKCCSQSQQYMPFKCSHLFCLACSAKLMNTTSRCGVCNAVDDSAKQKLFYEKFNNKLNKCYGCLNYQPIEKEQSNEFVCRICGETNCRSHLCLVKKCSCSNKKNNQINYAIEKRLYENSKDQNNNLLWSKQCKECFSKVVRIQYDKCLYCLLSEHFNK